MTNYLKLSDRNQYRVSRLMQVLLAGTAVVGFYYGDTGVIVNSVIGLAVTFLPDLIERENGLTMDPALVLWITSAVFFHGIGTLGPYGNIWWWDHFTHALSSSVVAAAAYASIRALDEHRDDLYFPPKIFFVFILIFVMAFGVIWELIEFAVGGLSEIFGAGRVLTQYGLEDTMKDLVFDFIGGSLVAVFGEIYLLDMVDQLEEKLNLRASGRLLDGK